MPTPFTRTLRSLEADGFRRSYLAFGLAALVLGLGSTWLVFGHVAVYATTAEARLESVGAAHPVTTAEAGRVVAIHHLELGGEVGAGEVLVELDAEAARLELAEERARSAAFAGRREAVTAEILAENRAWPEQSRTAALAIDEARARLREAAAETAFAESEAARWRLLGGQGLSSASDVQRAESEALKLQAGVAARAASVAKLESEAGALERAHEARVARLNRERALVAGEFETSVATIRRREHDLAQRRISAPVAGRLGEIAALSVGSFVTEGQTVAAVIPAGAVRVVAWFPPPVGVGRIGAGQSAHLRLDGYPWAQFGVVRAVVAGAAGEPRDGRIRVELDLEPGSAPRLPIRHGLTGSIAIEVERLSPAALLFRAAGRAVSRPVAIP